MRPEFAKSLYVINLAKGARATTAIEGNTLSLEQVREQIENKLTLPKSKEYLGHEIDNIVKAFNLVFNQEIEKHGDIPLCIDEIKQYNKLILNGLENDGVSPGEIRTASVVVGAYLGAPAEDCGYLLEKLCNWINDVEYWRSLGEDKKIATGILKAMVIHLYFTWIHPFNDGNGRTARLLEFKMLIEGGIPAAAAHLLSNYYNETRMRYYAELDRSSKANGQPEDFLYYALTGYVESLDQHIDEILKEQIRVAWDNYIHDRYKHSNGAKKRQRDLLLDISSARADNEEIYFTREEIYKYLSERLRKIYMTSSGKMFPRDLNAIVASGLLIREGKKFKPNRRLVAEAYISSSIQVQQ